MVMERHLQAMEEAFGSDKKGLKGDGDALKDDRKALNLTKRHLKGKKMH